MLLEFTQEELAEALERTVTEVLWEAGIVQPPVEAFLAADRLGLTVATGATARHRGHFVRLAAGAESVATSAILLAPDERPERRQWAVAHEIGEWTAHRVLEHLGQTDKDTGGALRERCANAFAGALLLPRRWFLADGRDCNWDLFALKARYATASHELIARRMLEMPDPAVVTLFDNGRRVWRLATDGWRAPPLLLAEEAAQRQSHLRGNVAEVDSDRDGVGRVHVRCWPIHEPGWKREIMRTEWEADVCD